MRGFCRFLRMNPEKRINEVFFLIDRSETVQFALFYGIPMVPSTAFHRTIHRHDPNTSHPASGRLRSSPFGL
jgi:hypothetical protein